MSRNEVGILLSPLFPRWISEFPVDPFSGIWLGLEVILPAAAPLAELRGSPVVALMKLQMRRAEVEAASMVSSIRFPAADIT